MTAQEIKNAIDEKVNEFLSTHNISLTTTLVNAQNVELTDAIAETLDTVNPTHNYPPVLK